MSGRHKQVGQAPITVLSQMSLLFMLIWSEGTARAHRLTQTCPWITVGKPGEELWQFPLLGSTMWTFLSQVWLNSPSHGQCWAWIWLCSWGRWNQPDTWRQIKYTVVFYVLNCVLHPPRIHSTKILTANVTECDYSEIEGIKLKWGHWSESHSSMICVHIWRGD